MIMLLVRGVNIDLVIIGTIIECHITVSSNLEVSDIRMLAVLFWKHFIHLFCVVGILMDISSYPRLLPNLF